jgi:hypothetical protein
MLEERGLWVERQVFVAFAFNGMHFDDGLRVFASSRESESRGAREDAILREMDNFLLEL